jgi:hypothetical protein
MLYFRTKFHLPNLNRSQTERTTAPLVLHFKNIRRLPIGASVAHTSHVRASAMLLAATAKSGKVQNGCTFKQSSATQKQP